MRHAGSAALAALDDLIIALRGRGGLKELRPGIFYRQGKAWLHFHEDQAGLFADLRTGTTWQRFRVSDTEERAKLLAVVDRTL
jgi:hypothetical protein